MAFITLSNGGTLIEERFSFPDPELIIRTVFRFEDIKYLKARNSSEIASIVYFYDDRDYLHNLTHYTGETSNSPLSRYQATHSKKEWCQSLTYPIIGMAESVVNPWDTETRKTIEALCAYKMKQQGFNVVNADTMNWTHGVVIPPSVNGLYADSVAKILVQHQIALLGLSGTNIHEIAKSLGHEVEEEIIEPDDTIILTLDYFKTPNRISSEEKFRALLLTGQITAGEPLFTNHRLIHRAVTLKTSDSVEYRGVSYKPRDALKAMAHEAYTEGLTTSQVEGWKSYDAFGGFAVERDGERKTLASLWNKIKPTEFSTPGSEEPAEIVDEEWYQLVVSNGLAGSQLICNQVSAVIGEAGSITFDGQTVWSLTAFGEAVGGLQSNGYGDFTVYHQGENYLINSD